MAVPACGKGVRVPASPDGPLMVLLGCGVRRIWLHFLRGYLTTSSHPSRGEASLDAGHEIRSALTTLANPGLETPPGIIRN